MKIGIIVLCRYDSKRLPGKILKKIQGKTILSHIIDRLHKVRSAPQVVVATSTQKPDDIIQEHCNTSGIPCYRGDLQNVAERFLSCAQAYQFDYAVRINGDNLFTDPILIDLMIDQVMSGNFDFISNVPDRTFPYGMSIEILKTDFYATILPRFSHERYHEHVTLYLYEHEELGKRQYFYNTVCPSLKGENLAIDNDKDLNLAEKIFAMLSHLHKEFGLKELCTIKDFIIHERMER